MKTLGRAFLALVLMSGAASADDTWSLAFPNLRFDNPVFIAAPPDGSNRLFVIEQDGRVVWFENRADIGVTKIALDITKMVRRMHMEEGLLGLAFHPKFKDNGYVFLQYSTTPRRNVIARFKMDARRETIDPDSETSILEVPQPYGNHNGGMLAFGPDGFLYIGLGDGGSGGDPADSAQNKGTLLGKMLRIDVDRPSGNRAYGVPVDNPFVNEKGTLPEIWAWGLRNPWRYSFDAATGKLWAGDVGQNKWEEIHIIEKGKNYGWARYEGAERYDARPLAGPYEAPLAVHGRGEAQSITGGYVYRGKKHPALVGKYVYGDFMTGNVWTLDAANPRKRPERLGKSVAIASFGLDRDGELYIASYDGRIYTLAR